ncbi:MAG: FG-GAP-like repeat-containing protein [Geminicoccaceae bacterium]
MATRYGNAGSNILIGTGQSDRLFGGGGNDVLYGLGGGDTLDGGSGRDAVAYGPGAFGLGSPTGVTVDLLAGTGRGGHAEGDVLIGIETVIGSRFGDVLLGRVGASSLLGLAGRDTLVFREGGQGIVDGGTGVDLLRLELTTATSEGAAFQSALQQLQADIAAGRSSTALSTTLGLTRVSGIERAEIVISDPNAAPSAPSFSSGGAVDENVAGALVGRLQASDPDNDTITFSTGDSRFVVDGDQLYLKDGVALDFEKLEGGKTTVSVTASDGKASTSAALTVTVGNVNEPPSDISFQTGGSVAENVAGVTIGTLTAVDPENDILTFKVSDPRFVVVGNELRLKDGVSLDYESLVDGKTSVLVAVTDGSVQLASEVEIQVGDENDAPSAAAFRTGGSVAENAAGAVVGTLTAIDQDNDTLTFSTTDARFTISGDELRLADGVSLDREALADGKTLVSVKVSDGKAETTADLVVSVDNANEAPSAPSFASGGTVAENQAGAIVGTLQATDPDGDSIVFTTSDARFEISGSTLRLKAGQSLDFEALADGKTTVAVSAGDGSLSTPAALTITVSNSNDQPGATSFLSGGSVAENAAGAVVGTLTASDPDNDSLTFATSDARFFIDGNQLKLATGQSLNFEALAGGQTTVSVTASDGSLSRATTLTVTVLDQNEAPGTTSFLSGGAVDENAAGAAIGRLQATDPDGTAVTFGTTDSRFEITDGNQLRLKAGQSLDFEALTDGKTTVSVIARDGLLSTPTDLTVTVNDIDERPPNSPPNTLRLDNTFQVFIQENQLGNSLGTLSAVDPDNDTLTYRIVGGDTLNLLEIDASNRLKLKDGVGFDFESLTIPTVQDNVRYYQPTIRVTDSRGDYVEQTFFVSVIDVNEPATGIRFATGSRVTENDAGATIGTLFAVDPEGKPITFSIASPGSVYEIVGGNQLKLKAGVSLDYERGTLRSVDVIATAGGVSSAAESVTLLVVDDPADAATTIALADNRVIEDSAGAAVGRLSLVSPGFTPGLSFATSDARFRIVDGNLLALAEGTALDFETATSTRVSITATDASGGSITQTLTVAVDDLNNPPGNLDVLTAGGSGLAFVLRLGNGDGSLGAAASVPGNVSPSSPASGLRLADLDGDGDLDAVSGSFKGPDRVDTITVVKGNGDGTFAAAVETSSPLDPFRGLELADFNRDGRADLLVFNRNQQMAVQLNNGDGTFGTANAFQSFSEILENVAVGDVDGDGKLDVVFGTGSGASGNALNGFNVLLGDGAGRFETNLVQGTALRYVALGDRDGDGDLDLFAAAANSGGLRILDNDGNGNFTQSSAIYTNKNITGISLGDLNRDGNLDIVFINQTDKLVTVALTDAAGAYQVFSPYQTVASSQDVGAAHVMLADLDGDGDLDLITSNDPASGAAYLNVRLNDGGGGFGDFVGGTKYDTAIASLGLAIGELNSNNKSLLTDSGLPDLGPLLPNTADIDYF